MASIRKSSPKRSKAKKPSPNYQRASVRYRCPPATAGRIYLTEDLEFQRAWIQNLSTTGIGLLLSKPLERGLLLTIQMKSPHSQKDYRLSAHAVHSTQGADGAWLVGCQFLEPLSNVDLHDLL